MIVIIPLVILGWYSSESFLQECQVCLQISLLLPLWWRVIKELHLVTILKISSDTLSLDVYLFLFHHCPLLYKSFCKYIITFSINIQLFIFRYTRPAWLLDARLGLGPLGASHSLPGFLFGWQHGHPLMSSRRLHGQSWLLQLHLHRITWVAQLHWYFIFLKKYNFIKLAHIFKNTLKKPKLNHMEETPHYIHLLFEFICVNSPALMRKNK